MQDAAVSSLADRLVEILRGYGRVAVAYSGGVDSAVVAKAAHLGCGSQAVAITAVSASLAGGEQEQAQAIARSIGIRHELLLTREFENPNYLSNPTNRCYFCKSELYDRIWAAQAELQFDTLVNGTNTDDLGDIRPGLQAAQERQVRSPLVEAGINKQQVRELARHWNLTIWDKPASPCLSSRVAYGLSVDPERLSRIDQAEQFLKELLQERVLRVRMERADLARIELPLETLTKAVQPEFRAAICARLEELGFRAITLDLNGFRSGNLNAALPVISQGKAASH